MADDEEDVSSPGWDAIDEALETVHGSQEPAHFGPALDAEVAGEDPLTGVSVYRCPAPVPHFHYVTYGFSELWEKETDDPEVSGYGFELTFRLARGDDETEPPTWPISLLQNLARYVFRTGNAFGESHHLDLNGPISADHETDITGVAFARDQQLGEITTPNGKLVFLQVVGLTSDEYMLIKAWNVEGLLSHVQQKAPMFVTDLDRKSILTDPTIARSIRKAAEREGSSQAEVLGEVAGWRATEDKLLLRIGANPMGDVIRLLSARLGYGHAFLLQAKGSVIVFDPNPANGWRVTTTDGEVVPFTEEVLESTTQSGILILSLNPSTADELAATLRPERGKYRFPSLRGVVIEVVPSEIKDRDGKVIRTIG